MKSDPSALADTNIDSPALEAVLEGAETVWDVLVKNQVTDGVPILGTAIKILRASDDLRSRSFAAKLQRFVCDPSLRTTEAGKQIRARAEESPEEAKKIGESLFLVLERLTDLLKPMWLAKAFAAYLAREISASDLRRMAAAIDSGFGDDLLQLITWNRQADDMRYASWTRALLASGLTEVVSGSPAGGRLTWQVSRLGEQFRDAVRAHSNEQVEMPPRSTE